MIPYEMDKSARQFAMQLGKRLKQARLERELGSSELAAKLGLERSSISQYEAGRSLPSVTVLSRVARILGVSLDRLCFEEYDARDAIQDKELAGLLAKADDLQHRHRSLLIEIVESLLAQEELQELKATPRRRRRVA